MGAFETIEYRGYTINILPDLDALCPWENEDGLPPLLVYSEGHIESYGGELDLDPPDLTREQIRQNAADIADMFDYKTLLQLVINYANPSILQTGDEAVNDAIREALTWLPKSDQFEALATIYGMAGIPAVCKSIHGSCQGDYAEVLAVATYDFIETSGVNPDNPNLDADIQLFEHWAFGSVYGFNISKGENNDIDSCWGFYGMDWKKNGLLEMAENAIDCAIEAEKKKTGNRKGEIK